MSTFYINLAPPSEALLRAMRDKTRVSRGSLTNWNRKKAAFRKDRAQAQRNVREYWNRQLKYSDFRSIYGYYPVIVPVKQRVSYNAAHKADKNPNLEPYNVPLNVVSVLAKERIMREYYKEIGSPMTIETK